MHMSSKLKQLHEAKNVKDVFALVSWNTLQKLAVLPFVLFVLTPVLFLVQNIFESYPMESQIYSINSISCKLAAGVFIFAFIKALTEKRINKAFFKGNITLYFFFAFIILILVSTYVNRNERYALSETWRSESYLSFITYVSVYFGCCAIVSDRKLKLFVLRLLQIVSVILIILVAVDLYVTTIRPFHDYRAEDDYRLHVSCVFSHFNFYAYYLTLCILISAVLFVMSKSWKWKIFDGICFAANAWMLMRIDTLGCFLAGLFGLLLFIVIYKLRYGKLKFTVFLPLIVYLVFFIICAILSSHLIQSFFGMFGDVKKIVTNAENAGDAGTRRWTLWTHTVDYIKERPLLGFGNEGISDRLSIDTNVSRPHNEYLQYAAFFGIPAMVMYISGVFGVFLRGLKRRKVLDIATIAAFTAAFGYLVSALFGNTTCSVAPYLFCLLGFAYRPCKEKTAKTKAVSDENEQTKEISEEIN